MNYDEGKEYYGISLDDSEMVTAAARVKNTFRQIGNSAESEGARIDTLFNKIAGTAATVFTVDKAIEFAKSVADVRGEFQMLDVSFTTLLQSKEKADALMAQIKQTALTTPFTLLELANGAKQLTAYGFAATDVNDTLVRLGNIASGLGLPLERLTYLRYYNDAR